MNALEGIRILDLTWGQAGPAGILLLAEHGADVIKVEPLGGDPYREYPGYRVWNRSRRSVTIDLKSDEGKDRFLELAASADVLAESFRPGVMARLGLDYETLAPRFPHLIYVSVPAYPADSRHAGRAGWDALVQARSGQQYEQPGWRPGPIFLASPLPSLGALYLVPTAILAALHARTRTGRGQQVETSLYQGVLALTTMLWIHAEHKQSEIQSLMTKTYPPLVHQQEIIECADGWIQSVRSTQKKGLTLDDVFGIPVDSQPVAPGALGWSDELQRRLKVTYRDWKRADLVDRLHEDLFQVAEILPTRETLRHPQIAANDMVVNVDDPEIGPTVQVGMPFKLALTPAQPPRPRPVPGQHNVEVFAERRIARVSPGGSQPQRSPLDGIRVLDFGRAFAGPFAPMVLAGLGADVIKVATTETHPLGVGGQIVVGCEQGKRSILVDVKSPEGAEIVRKLVERSDIVHHNMTKGVAERLGIDHHTLSKIKSDIISCNTYMYGPEGPLSHLGGNDSLAQALCGFEWEAGPAEEGNDPLWSRFGFGDAANALSSVVGVLVALAHRDRTGEGQAVSTSLLNAATYLASEVYLSEDGASNPPKLNKSQTGFGALYRLYDTQDGWIQVAAVKEQHWPAFCQAVGRVELRTDERFASAERRHANRAELEGLLEPVFKTQTAIQWRRRLDESGVPAEISVNTVDGESVLFDEENVRLGLVVELEHPELGRLRQVGNLMRFSDTPSTVLRPSPVGGQHTAEIMSWLGYDDTVIEDYRTRGVIAVG